LKVIPVIDVLNGVVVHAVRGRRKEYQPLKSVLTTSVDPVEVAFAFKAQGFSELYLADLDAIQGKQPNFDIYRRIAETGLNFMVDAGVTDIKTAKKLQTCQDSKVIIGTETLQTLTFIKDAVEQLGADHLIVSVDMKDDKVLTQPNFNGSKDAFELLGVFRELCVSEFILLDLVRVGSGEGVNTALLKDALKFLRTGIYVGGGVRSLEDLLELKKLGVSGVLLATALHTGKIGVTDLKKAGLL
jgi:phosphoribosylformimino-5-aminoimidazole carboxamide ribotide isomerase